MTKKSIGAGAFKQVCLSLLDEVADAQTEVTITKRGRPVARLVPIVSAKEREDQILSALRGRGRMAVSEPDFLQPSSDLAPWSALRKVR